MAQFKMKRFRRRSLAIIGLLTALTSVSTESKPGHGTEANQTENERLERMKIVEAMPKIDAHAHVMAMTPDQRKPFIAFLQRHNLRWLDICTGGLEWKRLQEKMALARGLSQEYPEWVSWAPSFDLSNWRDPQWRETALETIRTSFSQGAVAVKVWKEIGMVLRDPDGRFVMIDDARFAPVMDEIARRKSTLVAHLGEPRNCWLPLAEMTTASDRAYFGKNPQYHAYLHPEIPSHKDQIAARDRILERYPSLKVMGCHLGSLEYDVDEVALRLDRYPNFAVDLAARLVHLQIQPREKVRAFLIKYQDRMLYATDLEVGNVQNPENLISRGHFPVSKPDTDRMRPGYPPTPWSRFQGLRPVSNRGGWRSRCPCCARSIKKTPSAGMASATSAAPFGRSAID